MTEQGLSAPEKQSYRDQYSRPILETGQSWLIEHESLTLPHSPIGKAIRYALRHWAGRVEIDNNATERDSKPFVMG